MTRQPNIAELKRLLGINLFLNLEGHALEDTQNQGLVCSFAGLRLSSAFQPIVRADGKIIGREALLRAVNSEKEPLSSQAAFEHAIEAGKLVAFDRLVRTIHLFNHANTFDENELIFLNVHPQLLTSVSNHGQTFERILHYYSVPTSRVVIEIQESAVKDNARLESAVGNYRNLGYQIAIDKFGSGRGPKENLLDQDIKPGQTDTSERTGWLNRVLSLRPEFVKLDRSVIWTAQRSTAATYALHQLVSLLHGIGTKVSVQNIETAEQLEIARSVEADLMQGHYLGQPQFESETRGKSCRNERLAA